MDTTHYHNVAAHFLTDILLLYVYLCILKILYHYSKIKVPVLNLSNLKTKGHVNVFYIHGSVHHELDLITVQQDATVFSLLYFSRQLYMFWVLTPIIRSSYNCNYSCTSS